VDSILKKVENKPKQTLGIVGILLTMIFGLFGLYSVFHHPKAAIDYTVTGRANVLDIHTPLRDLQILFQGDDIQQRRLNLQLLQVRVENSGETDIRPGDFDPSLTWGIAVRGGTIVGDVRLVGANSEYIKAYLGPQRTGKDTIAFKDIIFDKGKNFTVEFLVLHQKFIPPQISPCGKIASIDAIPVHSSVLDDSSNGRPSPLLNHALGGGLLVQIVRVLGLIVSLVAIIASIVWISTLWGFVVKKHRQSKRAKFQVEIDGTYLNRLGPEQRSLVANLLQQEGIIGLRRLHEVLRDDDVLKRFHRDYDFFTRLRSGLDANEWPDNELVSVVDRHAGRHRTWYPSIDIAGSIHEMTPPPIVIDEEDNHASYSFWWFMYIKRAKVFRSSESVWEIDHEFSQTLEEIVKHAEARCLK
jgi:hypothetical protein